jgi:hypothetical protein
VATLGLKEMTHGTPIRKLSIYELPTRPDALLFFRHGITRITNMLYQFLRRGTMSTPAEALAKFWEDLHSKARVETVGQLRGELAHAREAMQQVRIEREAEARAHAGTGHCVSATM